MIIFKIYIQESLFFYLLFSHAKTYKDRSSLWKYYTEKWIVDVYKILNKKYKMWQKPNSY